MKHLLISEEISTNIKSFNVEDGSKSIRFFPQIKVDNQWVFLYPINKRNGHKTIESCETIISALENTDTELNLGVFEYRIKEERI